MSSTAGFFTDGAAYERVMGRWSRIAGQSFLDWLQPARGLRWLDSGCGNGAFTELIVERCAPASVAALDPSDAQIAYARTRPGASGVQFEVGNAERVGFGDASFDAATMALVLAFLDDPGRAVAELARVVRPGGVVASYMWDIEAGGTPLAPLGRALRAMGITPGTRPSDFASRRDEMQRLWQQAGLADVDTTVIKVPVRYASVEEFCDIYLSPIGPQGALIAKMSPDDLRRLRGHVSDYLPATGDGMVGFDAVANAVKGRVPG